MAKKNLLEEIDSGFDSLGQSLGELHIVEDDDCHKETDSNCGKTHDQSNLEQNVADDKNCLSDMGKKESEKEINCEDSDFGVYLTQDDDGDSILHLAICSGKEELALQLIDMANQESLNEQNFLGQTPLFLAVMVQMRSVIRKLIDIGVDIETCDVNGNSIIHVVAELGLDDSLIEIFTLTSHRNLSAFSSSLQMLMESKNYEGFTPLHLAARNKKLKTADLLCRIGADVNETDLKAGFTALHHLVLSNNVELVNEFIEMCCPDVNAVSYSGVTPLHLAMSDNSDPIAHILIIAGADTGRETIEGLSWDNPNRLITAW